MADKPAPKGLRVERRRFARFDIEWPVEYPVFGETAFATTENISRGGMLVAGVPLATDDELEFALHGVGIEPLVVVGRVCRSDQSGTHVEFVDTAGDPGPAIERFIEQNVIPGLIGSLTGNQRDTQNLRLVSSWYRELGREDRALDVCRGAVRGATTAGPYEELAVLLITRAKRIGVHGGFELLLEARRVIGQGLKVVASQALVLLYEETTVLERNLRSIMAERQRQLEAMSRQRPMSPEPPADELLYDDMQTEPMLPIGAITQPDLPIGATTDPMLPIGAITEPDLPLEPVTEPDLPLEPVTEPDLPITEPGLPLGAARADTDPSLVREREIDSMELSLRSRRPDRGSGWTVTVLLLAGVLGAGVWMWRAGHIRVPAFESPAPSDVAPAPSHATPASVESTKVDPEPDPEPHEELTSLDEGQYADLLDLEPELLARPPRAVESKARRKKRRAKKKEHAPGDALFEKEFTAQKGRDTLFEKQFSDDPMDRFARAKDYFKQRKVNLAIQELEVVVREMPRHAEAYRLLGVAYTLVGRKPSSIRAFKRFVALAPNHKDVPKVRAIIADYER